ncbi:rhodanese-like domain-containing protein [Aquimarina sediminis]|uniref:rhodanese-like domain-containing protein n=1 Tax=Aquimarina sediminis TaxID=2070536 RepID=UPI000CA06EB9|nr:rhodanese-like domain-containing protein [Aquimarina sediminis]
MKIKSFLIVVCTTLLLCNCKKAEDNNTVEVITVEEMDTLLKMREVHLIDVRTPEEFAEEHIKGATNIDFRAENFEELINKVDKTKPIAVYCRSGGRSGKCSSYMKKAGFTKVYDLGGGIIEWKFKGKDVVK